MENDSLIVLTLTLQSFTSINFSVANNYGLLNIIISLVGKLNSSVKRLKWKTTFGN